MLKLFFCPERFFFGLPSDRTFAIGDSATLGYQTLYAGPSVVMTPNLEVFQVCTKVSATPNFGSKMGTSVEE